MTDHLPEGSYKNRRLLFIDRHLTLVAAIVTVAFATLRVYFTVGFDVSTSMTVLAVADRTALLASSFLNAALLLGPALLILSSPNIQAWFQNSQQEEISFQRALANTIIYVVAGGLLLAFVPLITIGAFILGLLSRKPVQKLFEWRAERADRKEHASRIVPSQAGKHAKQRELREQAKNTYVLIATLTIASIPLPLLASPWLPLESIELEQKDAPIVGYTVGAQGSMTLILQQPDNRVRWVKTDEISERRICKDTVSWPTAKGTDLFPSADHGVNCDLIINHD